MRDTKQTTKDETMENNELKKRIKSLSDYSDCCQLASDLYPADQNSNGTPEECFVSGWVNAADMIDNSELDAEDWESVSNTVLDAIKNHYPELS